MSPSKPEFRCQLEEPIGTHVTLTSQKLEELRGWMSTSEIRMLVSIICQHGEVEITELRWEA